MISRIENISSKHLIGFQLEMSLVNNKTGELWQRFMPRRKEVKHRVTSEFISMQIYNNTQSDMSSPDTLFKKWAVVEVSDLSEQPADMESYQLDGGLYVVFIHNGPARDFPKSIRYIFGEWLPNSDYEIDNREQFEVLPEGYNPIDPNATEEIWVPIKTVG